MNGLRRKLNSQRGASLLLALLFLLICSMVSASILMAAAADAGKHRSNLAEHQTYLALSSAVSLLCDELNRSEYRGAYRYWEEHTLEQEGGTQTTVISKYLRQEEGSYTHRGTGTAGSLRDMLLKDFDAIFANEITSSLPSGVTSMGVKTGVLTAHALTLTPSGQTHLEERTVSMELEVQSSYAVYITAWLTDLPAYKIQAELTPNDTKPTLGALTAGEHQTAPMQWRTGWITTGGGEAAP